MADADAVQIAREELTREGINPNGTTGFTAFLCFLSGVPTLFGIAWYINPGTGTPPLGREEAVRILSVSVPVLLLAGVPGWIWARARLRGRLKHLAKSPNRTPGLWDEADRSQAGCLLGALPFVVLLFVAAAAHRVYKTGPGFEAAQMALALVLLPILATAALLLLLRHRRLGGSRFVPQETSWRQGQTVAGLLEATPLLARAREVRFDLVEKNLKISYQPRLWPLMWWSQHLDSRATCTVPASAFEAPPGLTVVPFSLRLPESALPSSEKETGAWHGLGEHSHAEHSWELHATANMDGTRYAAKFELKVGTAPAAGAPTP